jgi:hypothetical protein
VLATSYEPNRADGRWYVDIPIDAKDQYFAFARLALARYQPSSVQGAALSEPTLLDFLQVPAGRKVTAYARDENTRRFVIEGKFRDDSTVRATLLVEAKGSVDYAENPDRGDLLLDENGLWMPYLTGGLPTVATFSRVSGGGSMACEITIPDSIQADHWRVYIEETEAYVDTDLNAVQRTVWFATYDQWLGFAGARG